MKIYEKIELSEINLLTKIYKTKDNLIREVYVKSMSIDDSYGSDRFLVINKEIRIRFIRLESPDYLHIKDAASFMNHETYYFDHNMAKLHCKLFLQSEIEGFQNLLKKAIEKEKAIVI